MYEVLSELTKDRSEGARWESKQESVGYAGKASLRAERWRRTAVASPRALR
jgi:hypothetical protein